MNLVLHIVQKDIRHLAFPLALWAACGACAMLIEVADLASWFPVGPIQGFAGMLHFALGFTAVAWIIQVDSLRDTSAFWRGRPISPMTLLGAKLTLLGGLFVLTPLIAVLIGHLLSGRLIDELVGIAYLTLFLTAIVMGCAALAASTRHLGEYILLGTILVLAGIVVTSSLRAMAGISVRSVNLLTESRLFVSALLWIAFSVASLVIQYRSRRTLLSFGILCSAVVGTALVQVYWK